MGSYKNVTFLVLALGISLIATFENHVNAQQKQEDKATDNNENSAQSTAIVVALVSAGVSVFSVFRTEKSAKKLREHDTSLAKSKQEFDKWLAGITDARERELSDAKLEHEKKLAEWTSEREKELQDAKRSDEEMLEQWKATRESRLSEEKALRDYQYEARRKLYDQFEPLLFQFNELADDAFRRIVGFCREAKNGDLRAWLSDKDGYYLKNTIYRLVAPIAVFRLMQSKLTFFDLNLEPCIKVQYSLIKALYQTFSDDLKLAKAFPAIDYDPYKHPTFEHDSIPDLQGLYQGDMEQMLDGFIFSSEGTQNRIISYGEFENRYSDLRTKHKLDVFIQLLSGFHPQNRPVLWRILLAQIHIYKAIMDLNKESARSCENIKPLRILSTGERSLLFDWRSKLEKAIPAKIALDEPFIAVETYLASSPYASRFLKVSELKNTGPPV